uniref:Uncharacterized protein n=1 Tax=Rhizophora mucronata TaxID=61149 RepID=A0A2P2MJ76_RHIMU
MICVLFFFFTLTLQNHSNPISRKNLSIKTKGI